MSPSDQGRRGPYAALDRLNRAFEGGLTEAERHQPFAPWIEQALEDEWWLQHGVAPFPGAVDDWPATRADGLQMVIRTRESAERAAEQETRSQQDYQRHLSERGKR
jgi:hypothetical protein